MDQPKTSPWRAVFLLAIVVVPIALLFATQERDSARAPAQPAEAVKTKMVAQAGALICYDRDSWQSMMGSIADQNYQQMRTLLQDAKCQKLANRSAVTRIDSAGRDASLIQMPSGRVAVIFDRDLADQ